MRWRPSEVRLFLLFCIWTQPYPSSPLPPSSRKLTCCLIGDTPSLISGSCSLPFVLTLSLDQLLDFLSHFTDEALKVTCGHLWRTGHKLTDQGIAVNTWKNPCSSRGLAWSSIDRRETIIQVGFCSELAPGVLSLAHLGSSDFLCTLISHIFDILLMHVISASYIKKCSGNLFPPICWQNKHLRKYHKNKYCHMFYLLISQTK